MSAPAATDAHRLVGPTAGIASVGLSVFLLLASGPRLLGEAQYSVMAVSWTIITIFALGLSFPAEQSATTQIAGGSAAASGKPLRIVWAAAAATLLIPLGSALGVVHLLGGSLLWSGVVTAAAFAYALTVAPRGALAGRGRFHAYGLSQVVEGAVRTLLIAAAWVLPGADLWLAAAMVLPVVASAEVAHRRSDCSRAGWRARDSPVAAAAGTSFAALVAVAMSFQVVLNSAPLVIQSREPGDLAGQYVSATTYMRIPLLLVGGAFTVVLSTAATAWARSDGRALDRALRLAGLAALAAALMSAAAAAVAAPVLRIYYGAAIDLGGAVIVLLGAVTVAAVAANLLTQVGIATIHQKQAAAAWVSGALVTAIGLAVLGWTPLAVTACVVVGLLTCCVPLVALAVLVRGRLVRGRLARGQLRSETRENGA